MSLTLPSRPVLQPVPYLQRPTPAPSTGRESPLQLLAAIGILGTVLGTATAVGMIPSNPFAPHALRFPGLALIVGLLFVPVYCAITNFRSLFRTENLVMFGLIYLLLLDVLQGHYPMRQVSVDGLRSTFLAIGIFSFCFWLCNLAPAFQIPQFIRKSLQMRFDGDRLFNVAVIFFCVAMFNYLYASGFDPFRMFYHLLANRWYAPWVRGAAGGWESFRDHLVYFGYLLPLFVVAIGMQRGWVDGKTLVALILAFVFELFQMHGGNRRIVGATIGGALLYWNLFQPRLSIRQVIINLVVIVGILLLMQVMLQVRTRGLFYFLYYEKDIEVETDVIRVDDNFLRLAQVIDLIPARHSYVYFDRFLYTLARPIPRILWQNKPLNPGFDLAKSINAGQVNLTFSVLGDWYMSYGFLAVALGGVFYGRLSSMWSRLLVYRTPTAVLIYCLGCMAIFVSLRSFDELLLFAYPLVAWFAYISFFSGQTRPAPTAPA